MSGPVIKPLLALAVVIKAGCPCLSESTVAVIAV
jgi:hypothetical protein